MPPVHAIHRRFQAEDLVRLRRSDERQRYAASQRRGRIDPNPHQIDAVIFALRRIREGGCILADEVGLGKTIEAGLVIAQVLAEGMRRILVIVPKPLLGQWQNELYTLFGLETREGSSNPDAFHGAGVFLVGREFAGNEVGAGVLAAAEPFDLCVIDEAHEIFSGIYKRFARDGSYRADSTEARMADRVRSFLGRTPVMLLTATPIQNNLAELWGLVQYVEPTGTLLGSISTFREVFCDPGANDRVLVAEQAHELRRRINTVCQRTLRRQAQEFLEKPFTRRQAMLFEYAMSPAEKSLYDDVTEYLMEPNLCAFSGNQRRLLLISFHRLMASSLRAFAKSLNRVADRLKKMLAAKGENDEAAHLLADDLEHEDLPAEEGDGEVVHQPQRIQAELERVEGYIQRTKFLNSDGKAQRLKDAVRLVIERGQSGAGSGKLVIFTESLTTQDYLRELLLGNGLGLTDGDVTLFRGVNDSPRAQQALARWREEVERHLPPHTRPSRQVAVRLALVHEFQSRSRAFISTEAGAKGLNLQFCDTIINYDLPWNPQRIEQRIGRCHRYSQQRDVTVINFLAKDNEAQRLLFQILSEKLDLFGQVLDASDVVLHQPATDAPETLATAFGADLESQVRRIHERARSPEELAEQLRQLAESMDEQRKRFDETQSRMASLIESRFDDSVRHVFRRIAEELPGSLAELDRHIERVVCSYLDALGIDYTRTTDDEGRVLLAVPPATLLPEELRSGFTVALGHAKGLEDVDPLHLGHALVTAAVEESRAATNKRFRVAFDSRSRSRQRLPARDQAEPQSEPYLPSGEVGRGSGRVGRGGDRPNPGGFGYDQLPTLAGRHGRLAVTKLAYHGFEPVERLIVTAVLAGEVDPLDHAIAEELLHSPTRDLDASQPIDPVNEDDLEDAIEEAVFRDQSVTARFEQERFERLIEQIERYAEDQALVQRRRLAQVEEQIKAAQKRRETAMGPDARTSADKRLMELEAETSRLEKRILALESRQDDDYQRWRDHAHQRRYVKPVPVRILDVEFVIE